MKKWYVLRFATNRYKAVEGFLLLNRTTYFCPMRANHFTRTDKQCSTRKRLTPAFPGYLFVQIDFETTHPEQLSSFQHIYGLVSFGREPLPVSQVTIDIVKSKCWKDEMDNLSLTQKHKQLISILNISDSEKRCVCLLNYLIENQTSTTKEVKHAS